MVCTWWVSNDEGGPSVHSAGVRSQYHSIQQLSQSGRPEASGIPFARADSTIYGQWLGCGGQLVGDAEDDTLQVLRSLLRRYDRCTEPRSATLGVFDNDSDEV